MAARPAGPVRVVPEHLLAGPGFDEVVGEETGRGHEEGARAAGDVRYVQVEDVVGRHWLPLAAVVGLMGAGRVDERFEGIFHYLLGERPGCVVGAGVAPRRGLGHH